MLLTISTSHVPATDLGFLLAKHPDKCQSFELSFGTAHVFYPQSSRERCAVSLLVDVDPVALVRGRSADAAGSLQQYVNDRPYVASSFLSVAIAQVFGSALHGKSRERPELATQSIELEARLSVVPCRGGEALLRALFEPLGYAVVAERIELDSEFPEWGPSPYFDVTLSGSARLSELLSQLYVLLPVLDDSKHYYVSEDEIEKLVAKGEGWLGGHPRREQIAKRYLKHKHVYARQALAQLLVDEQCDPEAADEDKSREETELEKKLSLNERRLRAVVEVLTAEGAESVVDLGCGEGKLLRALVGDKRFSRIVGVDASLRALEVAERRLRLDELPPKKRARTQLLHGALTYRDARLAGFDAACLVEVIEHVDLPRLAALERAVFEFARPRLVVVTTPNVEYNVRFEGLSPGRLRHQDHRFEWTRAEFREWARRVAEQNGYRVRFSDVGDVDEAVGAPTQLGVFSR
ncbi:MAG: 3' terminal RNA ribose 2'-O-methyltransferase Hen1 [Polyangiaceae bacterium]|nr:3' terminal RNA ribose 2'-O-methyltransferase Hen1 [Polyangiaceae bacterium]